ncbi:MAG: ABC transporter ATP-binding protein [Deltaproteobacteria bacterium]|nr:MAG: ABC transporter ATP-binding protein [Deltaproteobacteria bacterium]
MSIVNIINIAMIFPGRTLFQGLSFQIDTGDRIGLVGPNGSGKTTLLRLLNREIQPESGEIVFAKGIRVGYLPQDVDEESEGKLLESVVYSVPSRRELELKVMELENLLDKATAQEQTLRLTQDLGDAHQALAELDLSYPRYEAEKILLGLGFQQRDFSRPVASLSGGWKMRAFLARLLYQKPDLLLLDEPTNHLDVPSVKWLEDYLYSFRGALVLVSHDSNFLNRQTNRTIGFEPEGVRIYAGNYAAYIKAREEERSVLEAKAKNQEQKIKEAQRFVERFKAKASKARQAQSKIKLIKKMELIKTFKKQKTIHFKFPPVERSGRIVFTLENLAKGFGTEPLYSEVNLSVIRGDRIAVIGPNGCGKTTLLKLLAGELEPDYGKIRMGHGVKIAYFAQHHSEMLRNDKTVLEEVAQSAPDMSIGQIRNVCGAFLFSGNEVEKLVGVLSGGERARVLLAKLLVNPGNVMIMDEPTNHLDIVSSETLIESLQGYNGTLIFVSHNTSFINRLATKIWDVSGHTIIEYPGNLDEYYDHLARKAAAETSSEPVEDQGRVSGQAPEEVKPRRKSKKDLKRERAERRRQIQQALNPIELTIHELEEQISALENRQAQLEEQLSNPEVFKDSQKGPALAQEYKENKENLDKLLYEWEEKHQELERVKKELGIG